MLVMFSGVPGCGKSVFARHLAQHLHIPLFSRDSTQQFLYQHNLIQSNSVEGYYWILQQAEEQLSLGVSCILDAVFPRTEFRNYASQIAMRYHALFYPIYCHCTDFSVLRQRWHRRLDATSPLSYVSHWMPFTWEDVERIHNTFEPWQPEQVLSLDAMNSLDENFAQMLKYLTPNPTDLCPAE